jgi:hypothetical protein
MYQQKILSIYSRFVEKLFCKADKWCYNAQLQYTLDATSRPFDIAK